MINSLNATSASYVATAPESSIVRKESLAKTAALPVIENLGNLGKVVGDRAYVACCIAGGGGPWAWVACSPLIHNPPLAD